MKMFWDRIEDSLIDLVVQNTSLGVSTAAIFRFLVLKFVLIPVSSERNEDE